MIQAMVINLRRERNRYRSVKGVAEISGVASSTISDILNGNTWPSLETMARLEAGLGVRLWPGVKATRGNTKFVLHTSTVSREETNTSRK